MFKKIVSKMPFNPSLISHLRDYDLNLKKELRPRIIGLLVLVGVILVQTLVFAIPPMDKNINSPNNLVTASQGTASELFNECTENLSGYKDILSYYGLDCSALLKSSVTNLNVHADSNSLYSLNRLAYGANNERMLAIKNQSLYVRKLSFGNKLVSDTVKALKLNSKFIYIEANSGNIISTNSFLLHNQTSLICSKLHIVKCFSYYLAARDITSGQGDVNNSTVSSGDVLAYTLLIKNTSSYDISGFRFFINFNNALAYSNIVNTFGGNINNGIVSYYVNTILPNQAQAEEIVLKVKSNISGESVSTTDPNYDNQKMITTFGNTISVFVPKSFNEFYETSINNNMPSSSYGASLAILTVMVVIYLYFILRILLVREEIKLIKREHLK